ncbi:KEKE-like motif-containing transcription regulator [Moesziomyces antarcticus T-34]|uniref:KEKE-like motif-containing transcription regulator n=1 Tax=Pseudozyma antarctica (strain T-34) TaxID=1151754 RepID=M9MBW0_PSEA3|nr:KEKE-like motif-containing transcription regulator [Moesziomyces antarcticus T-34]
MSTISNQHALSGVEATHTDATETARYSAPSPPRAKFDAAQLQPHLTSTLNSRLRHATWDKSDKERNRALSRSIAELVKAKMLGAFAFSTPTASCSCFTDRELALRQRSSQKVARTVSIPSQGGTPSSLSSLSAAGFKYIVQVQLVENLGQGGRGESERWQPFHFRA